MPVPKIRRYKRKILHPVASLYLRPLAEPLAALTSRQVKYLSVSLIDSFSMIVYHSALGRTREGW